MPDADGVEWWSVQEAARFTGLSEEAIRSWARGSSPRVRSKRVSRGKKPLIRVAEEDVRREARVSPPRTGRRARPDTLQVDQCADDFNAQDRLMVLEEVVRRHRIMDEHRDEIERRQAKIIEQMREIEELLLSPSRVPDR